MKSTSAMCPERARESARPSQRGFALVSAVFLLVVLALLGTYMLTVSSTQHASSALDVQGSRAYQAARAGIEWGAYQIMAPENATPLGARATCANVPAGNLALGGTLAQFTINVACVASDANEGGNAIRVFTLTSTAKLGNDPGVSGYVERQISAIVATCRKAVDGSSC